jgi:hypothetical protein
MAQFPIDRRAALGALAGVAAMPLAARLSAQRSSGGRSLREFGAAGDGVTDDTAAIAAAFAAACRGVPLFVPAGTYMCHLRAQGRPTLRMGAAAAQFTLYGEGEASVIRAFDGDVDGDWRTFIQFMPENDLDSVVIRDIAFDHNASGSPPPPTGFGYQHSGTLNFLHRRGITVRRIAIDNVTFRDPAADGVQFAALGRILQATVRGVREFARSRKRATVTVIHQPDRLEITDLVGHRIESEVESQPPEGSTVWIDNCEVDIFDFGLRHPWRSATAWTVTNSRSQQATYIENTEILASDCDFGVHEGKATFLYLPPGTRFTNCVFRPGYDAATDSVHSLRIGSAPGRPSVAEFDNCRFVLDDGGRANSPEGPLLFVGGQRGLGETEITLRGCQFDRRAEYAVGAADCRAVNLIGNDYGVAQAAVRCGAAAGKPGRA